MISKNEIENIVDEWIKSGECFLVDIKMSPSKISVFIDKPEGVSLDDCASLNRHLADALEPRGVTETHELEVSSPGMDQPLKVFQQYQRRIGREVKVITAQGEEHKGLLKNADKNGFDIVETRSRKENKKKVTTEMDLHFGYDQIKETKLILSFKLK